MTLRGTAPTTIIRKHAALAVIAVRIIAGLFALVAAGLTVVVENANPDTIMALLYPLFPGILARMLITGWHGGTRNEEIAAAIMAPMVNAIFYAALILIAHKVWRAMLRKPTAYREL